MLITKGPRGTKDVLPEDAHKWHYLEKLLRETCHNFGYSEMRPPIFEHTELFLRGVGETTDVVEKEMYTFNDRGGRSITLRPECTTSSIRVYLEHKLYAGPQPTKIYYIGPMFRYDRPQAGRYRQFNQFGVEVFGSIDPAVDAEVISLAICIFEELGLKNLEVLINSIGCPVCREEYRNKLKDYLRPNLDKLCRDCQSRFERNPLRILDCKNEGCRTFTKEVPSMLDSLCADCDDHFRQVQEYLKSLGIAYRICDQLVRGLDYYTKTVFEIISKDLGAQSTICGGGRYDGLIELCGGEPTPGIGFAMGMERVLLTLEEQGFVFPTEKGLDIFLAALGDEAKKAVVPLVYLLRKEGIGAEIDYLGRSLKAQMKYANKFNARFVGIIGDEELQKGMIALRDMATGEQEDVPLDKLKEKILQSPGGKE